MILYNYIRISQLIIRIMKFVLILALAAVALARPDDHYDTKFDDFNVDEVIKNERLMKNYLNCFITGLKCTPEGTEISKLMPEATQTSCAKCSEKQKVNVAKFIVVIKDKYTDDWATLSKKNDPDNKYEEELQKFLDKYSA